MKRRTGIVMVAFLAILVVAGIFGLIKNAFSDKSSGDEEATALEGELSRDEFYTYGDIEGYVQHLAKDDEQKKALDKLVDPLKKSENITIGYIKDVCDIVGAPKSVYEYVLADVSNDEEATVREFESVYANMVEDGYIEGVSRIDMYVYKIETTRHGNEKVIFAYNGSTRYEVAQDIDIEKYSDKVVSAYVKNSELFWVNDVSETPIVLESALVTDTRDGKCKFLYNGVEKTMTLPREACDEGAVDYSGRGIVMELTISNSGIVSSRKQTDIREIQVQKADEDGIRIVGGGIIDVSPDFSVYDVSEEPTYQDSMAVLAGYKNVKLYMYEDKAVAALVEEKLTSTDIRVILSNDDYSSYNFPELVIVSDTGITITHADESIEMVEANKELTVSTATYEPGDTLTCEAIDSGRITVKTINRECGNPSYAGKLEIHVRGEDVNVINVIPLEEYLYSVVASEMPNVKEIEALKAMAVCARGYAYTKMQDQSYSSYGADLDDSISCQLYNNLAETEESIKAVTDTYGLVQTYNDSVVYPVYYSTSFGMSCTNEEIWGGSSYGYLESNAETHKKDKLDLSAEEDFIDFYQTNKGYDIIEKDLPFYRWNVTFSREEISEAINSTLEKRIKMSEDKIKVKIGEDDYQVQDIASIGLVQSITVTKRSKSGVVMELEIVGSEATIQVTGQTNIRNLITPVNKEIVKKDNTKVSGWTSLPSPFYYVYQDGESFTIYGGGFGHGAGMSINGAVALAREGYNYKYILSHYYSYVNYTTIYTVGETETEK